MRWSKYFLNTLKENPKDAEAVSHQLMVRAGLIRRLGSGAYSYLPFGYRALQKVIGIIREEMNRAGAQELMLPALQPLELWKTTGRDAVLGEVLIRFKDRSGKETVLGPTHEEVVTDLMRDLKSYKQLPLCVYQIQTKFRDEPRPRFGVIRSKEFLMKDAYSFDLDAAGLEEHYNSMYAAYERIFARAGLEFSPCLGDSGAMGGDVSHEFMAPSAYGEGMIVRCRACAYAATVEAVPTPDVPAADASTAPALEKVATPGQHTVEEVSRYMQTSPKAILKTLIYEVEGEPLAVLVRGDHEVNEAKLARFLGGKPLAMAAPAVIRRVSGGPVGFTGPAGLQGVRIIADYAVRAVPSAVVGANEADAHYRNAALGRDFSVESWADLRFAEASDACPSCGGALEFIKGIEVGHVFKLGRKYTEALGIRVQDPGGKQATPIMGCYGIGVSRLLATVIEQHYDERGIVWPAAVAPFSVIIIPMAKNDEAVQRLAAELEREAEEAGIEALLDDREQSPGVKLKDADLVGIPVQVVLGKVWAEEGLLEVRLRSSGEALKVRREDLLATIRGMLQSPAERPVRARS